MASFNGHGSHATARSFNFFTPNNLIQSPIAAFYENVGE